MHNFLVLDYRFEECFEFLYGKETFPVAKAVRVAWIKSLFPVKGLGLDISFDDIWDNRDHFNDAMSKYPDMVKCAILGIFNRHLEDLILMGDDGYKSVAGLNFEQYVVTLQAIPEFNDPFSELDYLDTLAKGISNISQELEELMENPITPQILATKILSYGDDIWFNKNLNVDVKIDNNLAGFVLKEISNRGNGTHSSYGLTWMYKILNEEC